jgi:UDP-glucose 4-epimerase
MKTVLITGGAGFIGGHLARKYLAMDYRVYVLDDFSTGLEENLPIDPNLFIHRHSILDKACLKQFAHADLIIHLASVVGMKKVKQDADLTYRTATEGTRNVLECLAGIPTVLFSSSAVYGMTGTESRCSEFDELNENGLTQYDGGIPGYATGKRHMEQIGLSKARDGRKVLIVRPFNVIGERQLSNYGMVVPKFIKAAMSDMPLIVYGNGLQSRCFSDVNTFVDAMVKLIHCDAAWVPGGNIVNIGSDKPTTINSLAQITISLCGSRSTLEYLPFHEVFKGHVDVQGRIPDTTKFTDLAGHIEWPGIEQAVNKIFTSYLIEK